MMSTILVVGAKPGSIGDAIRLAAMFEDWHVVRGGIEAEEVEMDLVADNMGKLASALALVQPTHIVCTVGMNAPRPSYESDPAEWHRWHYETNFLGPMRLLEAWSLLLKEENPKSSGLHHYVAISSNSSRVPRSGSAAYCASKAALSMGLRVKAREGAAAGSNLVVYGYEPGLVADTPMTRETEERWRGLSLTRMRDERLKLGLPVNHLAQFVVGNLRFGLEMNGMLLPFDADEA
jgi:NAD(P)-dependent dehydrogenase (short-subunit alcohol dehydrogenase family)